MITSSKVILFHTLKYLFDKSLDRKYRYVYERLNTLNESQIAINITEDNDSGHYRSLNTGDKLNRNAYVKLDCIGAGSSADDICNLEVDLDVIRDLINGSFNYICYVEEISSKEVIISEEETDNTTCKIVIVVGDTITAGVSLGPTLEKELPRRTMNMQVIYNVIRR